MDLPSHVQVWFGPHRELQPTCQWKGDTGKHPITLKVLPVAAGWGQVDSSLAGVLFCSRKIKLASFGDPNWRSYLL